MEKVQFNYFNGTIKAGMTPTEIFEAGWQACLNEQAREKAMRQKYKDFNPYDFVSDDIHRPYLQGVFYKEGYAYASTDRYLIKVKSDYDSALEEKIIDKEGAVVADCQYPCCDRVIPDNSNLESISELVFEDFKSIRASTTSKSMAKLDYPVNTGIVILSMLTIDRLVKFWSKYPNAVLYRNKNENGAWVLKDETLDSQFVFMPIDKTSRYKWSYNKEAKLCLEVA